MTPIISAARLLEQEVYLLKWVGPEKKGVSKIFYLIFLTSDKHSRAKKSDRRHHRFSDPTLK